MPTIKLLPKKKRTYARKETDRRKARHKAYASAKWRKLRLTYLKEHPLCEVCLKEGKITPGEDIHHIKSFLRPDGEVDWELFLDPDNLMSLCKECHGDIHSGKIKVIDRNNIERRFGKEDEEDENGNGHTDFTIFTF